MKKMRRRGSSEFVTRNARSQAMGKYHHVTLIYVTYNFFYKNDNDFAPF